MPKIYFSKDLIDGSTLQTLYCIKAGAGALMAYGLCQSGTCNAEQVKAIESGLLKYCELDTLAMVVKFQAISNLSN